MIPNADETELMKMAVRMPDALKTERDEIDENDWKEIQSVVDQSLRKHDAISKRRRCCS